MNPTHNTEKFGVDAGNISVIDKAIIRKNQGVPGNMVLDYAKKPLCREIVLPGPGNYRMTISMQDTWNGPVTDEFMFYSESGRVILGDACYSWSSGTVNHDLWMNFLSLTDYLAKDIPGFHSVNTGGDGDFMVDFTYERV